MKKRICRDTQNKMISGVCSGIARYFDVDPTIVRLVWVVASLFTTAFPGIILYIVCALIIPEQNVWDKEAYKEQNDNTTYYTPPTNNDNN